MVTTTLQLAQLHQEVRLLRAGLISLIGQDLEGDYRPEFVREILSASAETPTGVFSNKDSFLTALKRA